jgi:AAA family ATP:ADP antiporter
VQISKQEIVAACERKYALLQKLGTRATFLFVNFFLIIMALYQLKPASRSLFIESLGAESLPYAWIITAVVMVVFISYYHRLVERHRRSHVVLGTCLVFGALLIAFRILFDIPGPVVAICFYVFVDILGVVLVEQFWSLTNSIYTTREGKSWYGFVGTGGLVGGVVGGAFAAFLVARTPLQTPDLLLTAAATIFIISGCEVEYVHSVPTVTKGSWRIMAHSRYLLLIAGILLLVQLVSALIDYQFLNTIEGAYPEREARTAFLSLFSGGLGVISIGINLVITPLVHRLFGAVGGLLIQPLMVSLFSWCFLFQSSLFFGGAIKISDRGLAYSINRASKELLYIPVDPVIIYQAKAWIDMFGYRFFKIFGSILILLFTQWLPITLSVSQLSWFVISICAIWVGLIMVLRLEYRLVCHNTYEEI